LLTLAGPILPNAEGIADPSRGFRNKQNFIKAIYFHCGGLDLARQPLNSRKRLFFGAASMRRCARSLSILRLGICIWAATSLRRKNACPLAASAIEIARSGMPDFFR
jgi:hypothetical protein